MKKNNLYKRKIGGKRYRNLLITLNNLQKGLKNLNLDSNLRLLDLSAFLKYIQEKVNGYNNVDPSKKNEALYTKLVRFSDELVLIESKYNSESEAPITNNDKDFIQNLINEIQPEIELEIRKSETSLSTASTVMGEVESGKSDDLLGFVDENLVPLGNGTKEEEEEEEELDRQREGAIKAGVELQELIIGIIQNETSCNDLNGYSKYLEKLNKYLGYYDFSTRLSFPQSNSASVNKFTNLIRQYYPWSDKLENTELASKLEKFIPLFCNNYGKDMIKNKTVDDAFKNLFVTIQGGSKNKSKRSMRKSRKSRKQVRKQVRKSRKSRKQVRKSRKLVRKSRKSRKQVRRNRK